MSQPVFDVCESALLGCSYLLLVRVGHGFCSERIFTGRGECSEHLPSCLPA